MLGISGRFWCFSPFFVKIFTETLWKIDLRSTQLRPLYWDVKHITPWRWYFCLCRATKRILCCKNVRRRRKIRTCGATKGIFPCKISNVRNGFFLTKWALQAKILVSIELQMGFSSTKWAPQAKIYNLSRATKGILP